MPPFVRSHTWRWTTTASSHVRRRMEHECHWQCSSASDQCARNRLRLHRARLDLLCVDDDLRRACPKRRLIEIAVHRFDGKAAAREQMLQLVAKEPSHRKRLHATIDARARRRHVVHELNITDLARSIDGPDPCRSAKA